MYCFLFNQRNSFLKSFRLFPKCPFAFLLDKSLKNFKNLNLTYLKSINQFLYIPTFPNLWWLSLLKKMTEIDNWKIEKVSQSYSWFPCILSQGLKIDVVTTSVLTLAGIWTPAVIHIVHQASLNTTHCSIIIKQSN